MSRLVPYDATLVERIDLTDTLAIFRIAPDRPPERPWFSAGQYCVLGLNNAANPGLGGVSRAMSIASAPEAEGPVEFYVRRVSRPVSANPLTPLLWPLTAGDRLHMGVAAVGTFTIHDTIGADDPRVRVLVAAGTGVAPFVSMIRSEVCRNPRADLSKWVLLHGVSYPTRSPCQQLRTRSAAAAIERHAQSTAIELETHQRTGAVYRAVDRLTSDV